jgi:hypothetical protein
MAFPPGGGRAFPPECRGVSPGVPWRFRRGAVAFPQGAVAFPPDGGRGLPRLPGAGRPCGPRAGAAAGLFPGVRSIPGAAVRDGTDPAVRPPAVSR